MGINKVLFVDDEVNILNSIKRSVIDEDYSAVFALSGEKAIEAIEKNEISVIVSDMKMPGMNGLDLLKRVKEISPNTIRIVLSGYTQLGQILATVNSVGVFKYITKPWNDELEFLPSIREAVNYYNLKIENDIMKRELEKTNHRYAELLTIKDELIIKTEADIINIRVINNAIIQIQNILFNKAKENVHYLDITAYYLKLINNIYTDFLNTFPATTEIFSMRSLREEFIKKEGKDIKVQVDNLDDNYEGNFRLLLVVLNQLLNYIIKKQRIDDILVHFTGNTGLEVRIKSKSDDFYNLYKTNIEFKLIINLLRELIKTSQGDLIIEENNHKELLILSNLKS